MSDELRDFILDASAALNLVVQGRHHLKAKRFVETVRKDPSIGLIVPDLFFLECANALLKYVRASMMSLPNAQQHMRDLLNLGVEIIPSEFVASKALALAAAHNVTAYDASYVAIASERGAVLVTGDKKLIHKLPPKLIQIQYLGDLESSD